MTSVGRLNIDVVARTGQFAAEMKRVRGMMRDTARAGSIGGRIGGFGGGGFGIAGGLMGLSGPMIAISGAIAALGTVIKAQQASREQGRSNLDEVIQMQLSPQQQAATMAAARVMRADGTSKDVTSMTSAFKDRDNRLELMKAGLGGAEIDRLNAMDLGSRLEEMRRLAISGRGGAIAGALGGEAGADFLQLRGVGEGLLAKAVETGLRSGLDALRMEAGIEARRQEKAAARDPNAGTGETWANWAKDSLQSFFRGESAGGIGAMTPIGMLSNALGRLMGDETAPPPDQQGLLARLYDALFGVNQQQLEQLRRLPSADI